MQSDRQRAALQTIFSFFLGIMVAAFIGVAVNTFYPQPDQRFEDEMQDLYRQQELSYRAAPDGKLTPEQEAEQRKLDEQVRELQDQQEALMEVWARNTSIVLILFATLVMGVSLIRSEQLRVISNGLLLGGLFTMVYGTGWVIASGQSVSRFFVMVFALVVTLGLGYVKFVRQGAATKVTTAVIEPGPAPSAELAGLSARVATLEDRTAAAAMALGSRGLSDDARKSPDDEGEPA